VKIEADTKIVVNGANHTLIDGINFKLHYHPGVQAGAGVSGTAMGPAL
jgi:alkyl sulfatase BDS1-like metallo-beta-lactamase superfamily hydrolase